ncbi:MAG: DUF6340 family protein [Bacteroidota bacterium]|nr:DUF6340 family protein [Bacteroidota bacterium]
MKKLITISGIVSLFFLSSCVTLNEFPIEVFQPAKITLPAEIKNVTLLSRNLKYENDTLQNYYSKDFRLVKNKKTFNTDSISVQACLDSLSQKLQAQKRFNKITTLPVSSFPVQFVKNLHAPSKNLIQEIASKTGADALIMLDTYSGFYSIYKNSDDGRSVAQVVTASIWTIFDVSKNRMISHTSLVDTVYWDGFDSNQNYLASRIPDKKAAIQIAAGLVGVNYSKNIIPYWATVYRNTISNNQADFMKAAGLAKMNKWEEASDLWKKYTETKNKRHKIHALYNLAIASEMDGNIEAAAELNNKASKISSSPAFADENKIIRKYSAVLAKRKIELAKLNSMNYE